MAALLALIPRARHTRLAGLVTPGTILRWHRDLVRRRRAEKSRRRPGRPRAHRNIARLVVRMARENENWGYRRIAGELAALGIRVAPSTLWEILKHRGLEPAPRREGPGWAEFLRSQAQAIVALDLFTVDLIDGTKAYVLTAIEHATRRIRVLGATHHPGGGWIVQQARNLLMDLEDTGADIKFILHDRDAHFDHGFDAVFTATDIRAVRSGVRARRMNAIMERWIGTCRRELLDRTLVWNLPHPRRVLTAYEQQYNEHRPHRTLASAAPLTPLPAPVTDLDTFRARRNDRIADHPRISTSRPTSMDELSAPSPSSRSWSSSVATTRSQIRPTVSQSIRRNRAIAPLSVLVARNAARSSKSAVKFAR